MTATRLTTRTVEKVWGRHDLWSGFPDPAPDGEPVGEIWFEDPRGGDPDLLVKYLFTSEKLSVQVHPDDAMARGMGLPRGKDEAWIVLDAEPDATIGIGLTQTLTRDELRAAALDGSIEQLLDWRSVAAGDVFYSPSGTIHAIGAGVTLIEIQQNSDTTFRLYDYGRARELHIEESIAAADPVPYVSPCTPQETYPGRMLLVESPSLTIERWTGSQSETMRGNGGPVWLVPVSGNGRIGGERLEPGGVWIVEGGGDLSLDLDADLLIAYGGATYET